MTAMPIHCCESKCAFESCQAPASLSGNTTSAQPTISGID
jgi:hypothetical protein